MSYANLLLYSAVIPVYHPKSDKGKKQGKEKVLRADDPASRNEVAALIDAMV